MHTFVKVSAAAALLAAAAACASRPPPPPETTPPSLPRASTETTTAPTTTPPAEVSSITPGSAEDFRVNVGERVFFDLDQYRLDSDDQEVLRRQAAWLQAYPNVRVMVAGNADERGTREYNQPRRQRFACRHCLLGQGASDRSGL